MVKKTYDHYSTISGQVFNWNKSSVSFGKGISYSSQNHVINMVGIRKDSFQFSYLGFILLFGVPKLIYFYNTVDKILTFFSAWKNKSLSFAGNIYLVPFVISFMFIQMFLVYKWPYTLLKTLIVDIKNFVWTSYVDRIKQVNVAWKSYCCLIKMGCLRLKNLKLFNAVFLTKFV